LYKILIDSYNNKYTFISRMHKILPLRSTYRFLNVLTVKSKISIQVICICLLTIFSCNKSNDGTPYSVSYEVITSGGTWNGQYDIYSESSSQVLWYLAVGYPNKWKYSFTAPRHQQIRLVLDAAADWG